MKFGHHQTYETKKSDIFQEAVGQLPGSEVNILGGMVSHASQTYPIENRATPCHIARQMIRTRCRSVIKVFWEML